MDGIPENINLLRKVDADESLAYWEVRRGIWAVRRSGWNEANHLNIV